MEKSLKSIAINYGLYLGALLALLTVVVYAINLDLFINITYGFLLYFIIITFGIIATARVKSYFKSYLSFKEAFSAYFITVLIGIIISSITSYILFNFIDTTAAESLKDKTLEMVLKTLKSINAPSTQIDEMIKKIKEDNIFSIGNVFQSLLINYLIPLSIIGLIVAAAFKKSNPEAK